MNSEKKNQDQCENATGRDAANRLLMQQTAQELMAELPGMKPEQITFRHICALTVYGDSTQVNHYSLRMCGGDGEDGEYAIIPYAQLNTHDVEQVIRSLNLRYARLVGRWGDNHSIYYFVHHFPLQTLKKQMIKFDIDFVVCCGAETKQMLNLLFQDGSLEELGQFDPARLAQAIGQHSGQANFYLECRPHSISDARFESVMRKTAGLYPRGQVFYTIPG